MATPEVVIAALAGATAAALLAGPARPRGPRPASGADRPGTAGGPGGIVRFRAALSGCAVVGVAIFAGGIVGLVLGLVAGAVSWRVLGRAEDPALRRERERLERDLPLGVDLLAICLRSGAAVEGSLDTVARAIGGPLGARLAAVRHRLALGADPVGVWEQVAADPALGPLGRAVGRSYASGASVVDAMESLADDLRERSRTEAEIRANGVEVRAAAPLGACFLPAFVLLGVVPLVAGVVSGLDLLQ